MEPASNSIPIPESSCAPPLAAIRKPFRAGRTLLAFLIILFVEALAAVLTEFIAVLARLRPASLLKSSAMTPEELLVASIAGTAVTLWLARRWAWDLPGDPVPLGWGKERPRRWSLFAWGVLSALVTGAYVSYYMMLRSNGHWGPGPGYLTPLVLSGGWSRATLCFVAIVITPVKEEMLFRGMLFKGFAASWGKVASSILVTLLFIAVHLSETGYHWRPILWISLFSTMALAARLQTGHLGCSMVVHSIASMVISGSWYLRS